MYLGNTVDRIPVENPKINLPIIMELNDQIIVRDIPKMPIGHDIRIAFRLPNFIREPPKSEPKVIPRITDPSSSA